MILRSRKTRGSLRKKCKKEKTASAAEPLSDARNMVTQDIEKCKRNRSTERDRK
mgnify:FL=1